MTDQQEIERIAAGLSGLEREWITGWQGVAGAAFNAIATDLFHKGLLKGSLNWELNERGLAVRNHLKGNHDER